MNNTFQPTYLYIKQHSVTKKCYFGKTTKDPLKYSGSGKHWKRHLKVHGKEFVVTLWFKRFTDKVECMRVALLFSEQQDIVKSEVWLNLKAENGIDGGCIKGHGLGNKNSLGYKHTPEDCAAISARKSIEMLGNKNALGYRPTPEARAIRSANMMGNRIALGGKGPLGKKNSLGYKHPKVICPHCKLEGASNAMKRHHFDNCKLQ